MLFAATTLALVALSHETRSLPIVFVQVADPVKLGFVKTLAHPGGNITGFTTFEYSIGGKWLELLKDTAPGTTRVAVIFDPRNPTQVQYVQGVEATAPSFGVQLTPAAVHDAAEVERAIEEFAQQPSGALIVAPNIVTLLHRDLIIALAAQHRLPAVYASLLHHRRWFHVVRYRFGRDLPTGGVIRRPHSQGRQAGRAGRR